MTMKRQGKLYTVRFNLTGFALLKITNIAMVLYMSFDKFLLAVESRDLSQADKSFKSVLLPKLNDG